MRFDDRLDEAEPKAEAALGPARVAAKQAVENPRELVGWNALPRVSNLHRRCSALAADRDLNASTCRRVLHRVVDQIRRDLLQSCPIGRDDDIVFGVEGERDLLRIGHVAIQLHRACDDVGERDGLATERQRAALRLRDVHQRVQHHEHAVRFLDAVGQRFAVAIQIGRGRERQFRRAPQARERRT